MTWHSEIHPGCLRALARGHLSIPWKMRNRLSQKSIPSLPGWCWRSTRMMWGPACVHIVDTSEAGEGCVEIEVTGPAGRAIPHTVTGIGPSTATVTFLPTECGMHHACITFNKESLPGNIVLFQFCHLYISYLNYGITQGMLHLHNDDDNNNYYYNYNNNPD